MSPYPSPGERGTLCKPTDTDEDSLSATKKLVGRQFTCWKQISAVRTRLGQHWNSRIYDYVVPGQRLVLREDMPKLRNELDEIMEETIPLITELNLWLPRIKEDAQQRLKSLYSPEDYPEEFTAELFSMEFREHAIEPPSYLAHSNAEEYRRQLVGSVKDVEAGLAKFTQGVWVELADLTQRLHNAMLPAEAGENRPAIHVSTLEAIRPLFDRVASLNFSGCAVLQEALGEVRDILRSVDVKDLRKSTGLRDEVREGIAGVVSRFHELNRLTGSIGQIEHEVSQVA